MKRSRITIVAGCAGVICAAVLAVSQPDSTSPAKAPEGEPAMQMQAPPQDPEHKRLLEMVGTWDVDMEMTMGGQVMKSKGTEIVKPLGDYFILADYTSDMEGMPFHGHGVYGYDPFKKKLTGFWVDSAGPVTAFSDGSYDAASKTVTMMVETTDPMTGAPLKMRETDQCMDDDTHVFKMFMVAPDGSESLFLKMDYRRRK